MYLRIRKIFVLLIFSLVTVASFAGVWYRIDGIMTIHKDKVYFQASNSNTYLLDIKLKTAKKYAGQPIQIDAIGKDSTSVYCLKVKKIRTSEKRIEFDSDANYVNYQKAAKLVSETDKEIKLKNVRWGRKSGTNKKSPEFNWRTATIKPDLLEKVYFVKKPFPPEFIAAHCFFFFQFKKGGFVDQHGNTSPGLVLTIEAHKREGQEYGLIKCFKKKFPIVWILTTWEDYVKETCKYKDNKLIPYLVRFDQEQNINLLKETIKQTVVDRSREFYHTTRNNCTNNLVILLNKFSERKVRHWTLPSMIYNVKATMPTMVPKYLYKKEILTKAYKTIDSTNYQKYLGKKTSN
jgi:hypothetical protein